MTSSHLPQPGALVAAKYRIEALLGQGGMGAVFAARHEIMDKPVALKWLHPELSADPAACERFLGEARAAARIRHPHVVDIYDVGLHEGTLYLVMELLRGQTLTQVMQRPGVPFSDVLRLLLGAMRGVQAAHAQNIVHRDIKPDNIFVVIDEVHPQGLAKVVDFGVSKLSEARSASITQTGSVLGTPAYMSLEQMNGSKDVDARTDIYAFGVLMYRALTGRLPYPGESLTAVAIQVATETPPRARELRPEIPEGLDEIVSVAMARDRQDRFESMEQLIAALEPWAPAEPGFDGRSGRAGAASPEASSSLRTPARQVSVAVPTPPTTNPPTRPESRSLAWVAWLLLAGATGAGWWWVVQPEPVATPEPAPQSVTSSSGSHEDGEEPREDTGATAASGGSRAVPSAAEPPREELPEGMAPPDEVASGDLGEAPPSKTAGASQAAEAPGTDEAVAEPPSPVRPLRARSRSRASDPPRREPKAAAAAEEAPSAEAPSAAAPRLEPSGPEPASRGSSGPDEQAPVPPAAADAWQPGSKARSGPMRSDEF